MVSILKNKISHIGLDIGHRSIRMIQFKQFGDNIKVIAAEEENIAAVSEMDEQQRREFMVGTIKDMYLRGGFAGRNVVSCLSNGDLKINSFRIALTDDEDIEDLVEKEALARFGLDVRSDEVRHLLAGKIFHGDEVRRELILFAAKREVVEGHISMLEEAGLVPVGIDSVPLALLRSSKRTMRRQADQDITKFYIDIGSDFTTVIIAKADAINFIKQIPMGGRQLNESVAERLNITIEEAVQLRRKMQRSDSGCDNASMQQAVIDAMRDINEKLAKEISLCFRYYAVTFRGKSPEDIILSGGEAYEKMLVNTLSRHLGIEVEIAEPLRGFELCKSGFGSQEESSMSEWSVVTGASIKGWDITNGKAETHERN